MGTGAIPGRVVLVALVLFATLGSLQGAPVRSKTYIIHTVKNETHMDVLAKHAWYSELMEQAKDVLGEDDYEDDGMDALHHVYHHVFDGFSARLTPDQVAFMKSLPCVRGVYRDRIHKGQTTHTPEFLGLTAPDAKLWPESKYGEDVIIGVVDSGIWPERLSFSDRLLGPVPKKFKGECETGTNFTVADCNRKIIGARYFLKGFEVENGPINDTVTEFKSPRGFIPHGTHCASTAAGRWAYRASYAGFARGTARGMAPKARIAVYKALWGSPGTTEASGTTSDIVQAIEQAVADGVDVISYSIGSPVDVDFFEDPISVASYNAAKRGVFFSAAAGNDGPKVTTVDNITPWVTTVAATTTDRAIDTTIVFGNGEVVTANSKFKGKHMPQVALVFAGDAAVNASVVDSAAFCEAGVVDMSLIAGKVLICNYDTLHTFDSTVTEAIAGLILADTDVFGESVSLQGFPTDYPMGYIGNEERQKLMEYFYQSAAPTVSIRAAAAVFGVKPAPAVIGFSSRGPLPIVGSQWLKPDIAAPGVDILAAGNFGDQFVFMSGTSMATPHISGIAALLRSVHPKWSPAAIKSAIMTTATTRDNTGGTITDEVTSLPATPWDFGAGFVQPEKAMDPGLVYDMGTEDYLLFLCGRGYNSSEISVFDTFTCPSNPRARVEDTNLPSFVAYFTIESLSVYNTAVTLTRRVTNVGAPGATYRASVDVQPRGFQVSIEPSTLTFTADAPTQSFTVTIVPRGAANLPEVTLGQGLLSFGSVSWSDGKHRVQSPVAILSD